MGSDGIVVACCDVSIERPFMRYLLVRYDDNRVAAYSDLLYADDWSYDEDFYFMVEAPGFTPDSRYDLSDYIYENGYFRLDEAGIEDRELNSPYSPQEVLATLFQKTDALGTLPDDILAHMAPYMAEWVEGVIYSIGDKVQYLDRPYRCLQNHDSQPQWTPTDAPSLWARILAVDPDAPQPWEQPDSTNPYMKGDKVTHNGHTWESDVDNNVWEPGVYGWTQLD